MTTGGKVHGPQLFSQGAGHRVLHCGACWTIGVLCIRRTLAEGRTSGFVSGLGAATADGLYGVVAGFGLTFLSNLLIQQQVWIRLIGGLFLCALGLKTFFAPPAREDAPVKGNGLAGPMLRPSC